MWTPQIMFPLALRPAGGFHAAGGAARPRLLRHGAEGFLPDVPRCAAPAQTEAPRYTQRPQGGPQEPHHFCTYDIVY